MYNTDQVTEMDISMRLILHYAFFFLSLALLSGCAPPKIIKTDAPIDFQFVTLKEGDTVDSLAEQYNGSNKFSWRIEEFNNYKQLVPGEELIIPLTVFNPGGLKAHGYQLIPVLSYHNFSKGSSRNKLTVSAKEFRKQLSYLKNSGYQVINMEQLVEFIEFGQAPEKSVLISIDDGWVSSYKVAYPILKEFGFSATLFISTQFIESGDKKAVTWGQVKEMVSDSTVDIQCHGKTHRDLSDWKTNESFTGYVQAINQDISMSKQTINDKLGKPITALAYPFGKTNPLVVELLKKQGYKTAFTVKRKSNPFYQQDFLLNRSMIFGTTSINKFAKNLKFFEQFSIAKPEPIDTLPSLASLAAENPQDYEDKKQWRTARLAWKLHRDSLLMQRQILANASPDSSAKLRSLKKDIADAQYKIEYLTFKLNDIAKQQYQTATHAGHNTQAKRLLLRALLNNPDNHDAINFFKSDMGKLNPISYQVKENDSFASIARQLYSDADKAILIPLFNDNISNENDLVAGKILSLPAAPIRVKRKPKANTKRCHISLTKPAGQLADDYYSRALEHFDHDHISQAIKNLKIAICLSPEHDQAKEMLDMLKDL